MTARRMPPWLLRARQEARKVDGWLIAINAMAGAAWLALIGVLCYGILSL